MPRPKKEHRQVSVRMNIAIYDRLMDYIEETGATQTAVIEKALIMYLDDADRKKAILEKYDK